MTVLKSVREQRAVLLRVLLAIGAGVGLAISAVGAAGDLVHQDSLDMTGIVLATGCLAALVMWKVRQVAARRPERDELLAQRVRNLESRLEAAPPEDTLARATSCERQIGALRDLVAECAEAAEIPSPDSDKTLPGIRAVGIRRRDIANLPGLSA